jgi:hypothetical protein
MNKKLRISNLYQKKVDREEIEEDAIRFAIRSHAAKKHGIIIEEGSEFTYIIHRKDEEVRHG